MELKKVTDSASSNIDARADDSTIYLFGSELYCGHCLEAFTCPVRLKIHCHVEHLATCTCGGEFSDKQSLREHVASSRCPLPPPFEWLHFMNFPNELNVIGATKVPENVKSNPVVDENGTADEKLPVISVTHLDESTQKTTPSANRKTLPKKAGQKVNGDLQALNQRKYYCSFCPYQSTRSSDCRSHIQRKHVGMPLVSSRGTSEKREDCIVSDKEVVVGTVSKNSATVEATTENELNGKSARMSPDTVEWCCEKHTTSDIQFVVGCFSSPAGGKSLCCDLCSDRFSEWENAAMHVYNSHFPALEQWRDTHANLTSTQTLHQNTPNSSDMLSAGSAIDCQVCEKLPVTVELGVSKCDHSVSSETVNVEHNSTDTSLDQSDSRCLENKTKHKFTTDKCKALASSLCKFLNCWNSVPGMEIPDDKIHHSSEVEVAVADSAPTPAIRCLNPTELASSDSGTTKWLIARKCKFCHRMCSTSFNCQRHEAVCRRTLPPSKLRSQAKVRFIHSSGRYYCTQCGFSDIDQHTVSSHLKKPHVRNKLCVEEGHGYDYIDSMRVAAGAFRCSLCDVLCQFRSKLLEHLVSHSSPATPCETIQTSSPESLSKSKMDKRIEKKRSGVVPVGQVRSCPRCSRSFSSMSGYLQHRAVCRVVPRQAPYFGGRKLFYLHNLCEEAPNGRWKCKLCTQTATRRNDLFKHIRDKHESVQKAEMEACVEFSRTTPDGMWQCSLCKRRSYEHRVTLYRHIRIAHADKVSEKLQASKLSDPATFGVRTSDGKFQCTSCKKLISQRCNLYRHFRCRHGNMLSASAVESSPASTVSSPSVEQHSAKNTDALSVQQKSEAKNLVRCSDCHRVFAHGSGYERHRKSCEKFGGIDRYVEELSSGRLKCSICSVTYSYRGKCRQHIRQKHLLELKPKAKQFVKRCPKCSREFTKVISYQLHRRSCEKSGLDCYVKDLSSGRVKCSICSVTYKWRYDCRKHVSQQHLHELKSTAKHEKHLLQLKSKEEHVAKRCPKCGREFTVNSSYQRHRRVCEKLGLDCYVEAMSDCKVRCRLCLSVYNGRKYCRKHIRRKHLLSGKLANIQHHRGETNAKTGEGPGAGDDPVSGSEPDKNNGTVDEIICKMEDTADDSMPGREPDAHDGTVVDIPVVPCESIQTPSPESLSDSKLDQCIEKKRSRVVPVGRVRSCKECSRSFFSMSGYLQHRAVCQVVPHQPASEPNEDASYDGNVDELICKMGDTADDSMPDRGPSAHDTTVVDNPVVPCEAIQTQSPESSESKMDERSEKKRSGVVPVGRVRSCPECSRSFFSMSGYLQHRAVCQVVPHQPASEPNEDASYDGTVDEIICKMGDTADDSMPDRGPSAHDTTVVDNPVVPCEAIQTQSPESSESKMDERSEKKRSGVVPVGRVRSCPECSRSFFSMMGYQQHHAVCQVFPRQQASEPNEDASYGDTVGETICKVEEPTHDAMPASQSNKDGSYDSMVDEVTLLEN